ncbi:spermidine synthase [Desulfobotulus alkaliphilus]|uniref:Polyamine aminopropyltransferase n=1 Tax=Desulfobotulus alkaliphilus TaxID=622671 RepID=A0A562RYP7_9BACT|nr:fused MFS/spermidine synthase [Desulfobotulus alkaliphilus]TWI74018.1 spermidine synthase [Desulfobotulus alkaliphilus]
MKHLIYCAVLLMGFSGITAEILLIRELLSVFSGNELSIAMVLANWLLFEAAGCLLAGRKGAEAGKTIQTFVLLTFLFCSALLVTIPLTGMLKSIMGIAIGESMGLYAMFMASFFLLMPAGMLHGALFTQSCRLLSHFHDERKNLGGRVYGLEILGTIAGGLVCTWLLIPWGHTLRAVSLIFLFNMVLCLALVFLWYKKDPLCRRTAFWVTPVFFCLIWLISGGQIQRIHDVSLQAQWQPHRLEICRNSPYGSLCVLENRGQYLFFQDGAPILITPIPDIPFVEKLAHLPLLAHPSPSRVMILGGGAGGLITEILKHPVVTAIDYTELDPMLFELLEIFTTPLTRAELQRPEVRVHASDGRLFLASSTTLYDLIFSGVPEPGTLQTNRYFTKEFFTLARNRLEPGGILVLTLPGSMGYQNRELRDLGSSIFHTLGEAFPFIRVFPGDGKKIFLASASPDILKLDAEKALEVLDKRGMGAMQALPWHMEQPLHEGWKNWFEHFIKDASTAINEDFRPLGMFYSIGYWNSLYAPAFGVFYGKLEHIRMGGLILLLFPLLLASGLYMALSRRKMYAFIPLAVFSTGTCAMLFTLILIFAFQSIYGYIFSWIGLMVAFFMAGSALAVPLAEKWMTSASQTFSLFFKTEVAVAGLLCLLPFFIEGVQFLVNQGGIAHLASWLFLLLALLCGFTTGIQFPLANRLYLEEKNDESRTAALFYGADLMGGWLGGMVGGVLLLPVLGLYATCMVMFAVKLGLFLTAVFLKFFHISWR